MTFENIVENDFLHKTSMFFISYNEFNKNQTSIIVLPRFSSFPSYFNGLWMSLNLACDG